MNKRFLAWALILISMAAGVVVRFVPRSLETCVLEARGRVMQERREQILKVLDATYPDMGYLGKGKLLDRAVKEDNVRHKREIRADIRRATEILKDRYQDEHGHVYLTGIDSYYWLMLLRNLLNTGHVGHRVVRGVEYDDLIGAPIDPATPKNIHLGLGRLFSRAVAFHPRLQTEDVLFYVPVVLSLVIAAFSFFVARRLGADDFGAFFASVAINLCPFLVSRSLGEWFDTDIYNVLFPLLSFGAFLYAMGTVGRVRQAILAALAGVFLACYASTWKGWWFIFDIMMIGGLFFIINQMQCRSEEGADPQVRVRAWWALGFLFLFTTVFVIGMNGVSVWNDFIAEPLRLWHILRVTPEAMWPNVYWTVAELSSGTATEIVAALGGGFIFFGGMIALLYLFIAEKGLRDARVGFGLFCLVLWVCMTFYAALEALRFILLMIVPVGLAFGLLVSRLLALTTRVAGRFLQKPWVSLSRSAVLGLLSMQLIFNGAAVYSAALTSVPAMNDDWHLLLKRIKAKTPPDAFINSWWDFGHWFKTVAGRRVLFDGMTQNTPYAYWTARVLLTDQEDEAIGLLRMINGSGNRAADILTTQGGLTLARAVALIRQAVVLPRADVRGFLEKDVPPAVAAEVMPCLFPEKLPSVYFIVSYDMLGKIGPISYIGNWDFAKVDLWFALKRLSRDAFLSYASQRYGYERRKVEDLYLELSMINDKEARHWFSRLLPIPSYPVPCADRGRLQICENGLVIEKTDDKVYVVTGFKENSGIPKSLFSMEKGLFKETAYADATQPFGALLLKDELLQPASVFIDPEVGRSMLSRLYYFKGEGLKYFKLWDASVDEKGQGVYVYEIQWPSES